MELETTEAPKLRDYEFNEAFEAHVGEELDGLSIQNQRLARVQEYEEAAVTRVDPYDAMIGMGNAYFQRIFEHVGDAVLQELDGHDGHPPTVEAVREVEPEIRLMVKIRKSIEIDLVLQTLAAGPQSGALPSRQPGQRRDTRVANSERKLVPKRWTGHS